jgi:hypothetical protein
VDLLGPARDPAEVIDDVNRLLGIGVPRVHYGDGLHDVSDLAGSLGR